jgi:hypothetical protein
MERNHQNIQFLMNHRQTNKDFVAHYEKKLNKLTERGYNFEQQNDVFKRTYIYILGTLKRCKLEIQVVDAILNNDLQQYHICLNLLKTICSEDLENAECLSQNDEMPEMSYITQGKKSMLTIEIFEKFGMLQFLFPIPSY